MDKTFQCANMLNIDYPFWGGNRPDYCGHPGFQRAESDSVFRLQPNSSSTTEQFWAVQLQSQALEGNSSSSTSLRQLLMVVLGCSGLQIVICAVNVSHRVGNVGMNRVQAHLLAFAQIKLMHPHALQLKMAFSLSLPGMSIFLIIKIYCRRRRCIASVKTVAFWKKDRDDDQNVEVFMRQYGSLAPKRQYLTPSKVEGEMGRPWEVVGGKSSGKRTESNQQQQEKGGKFLHLRRLHHVLAKRSGDLAGPGYSHPCTR
ncbi:unnamed protein product [Camellia sinensis]